MFCVSSRLGRKLCPTKLLTSGGTYSLRSRSALFSRMRFADFCFAFGILSDHFESGFMQLGTVKGLKHSELSTPIAASWTRLEI